MRSGARIPSEALIALHARLATLPARHTSRANDVGRTTEFYGVSLSTVYRQLRDLYRPKGLRRADRGVPRSLSQQGAERYCEIVAAMRTGSTDCQRKEFEPCAWERFCAFACEPERRKVGSDARLSMHGTQYEVDGDLAGEEVLLWWGLFDHELFAELNDKRYGPYQPVGGPLPLHVARLTSGSTNATIIAARTPRVSNSTLRISDMPINMFLPTSRSRREVYSL